MFVGGGREGEIGNNGEVTKPLLSQKRIRAMHIMNIILCSSNIFLLLLPPNRSDQVRKVHVHQLHDDKDVDMPDVETPLR